MRRAGKCFGKTVFCFSRAVLFSAEISKHRSYGRYAAAVLSGKCVHFPVAIRKKEQAPFAKKCFFRLCCAFRIVPDVFERPSRGTGSGKRIYTPNIPEGFFPFSLSGLGGEATAGKCGRKIAGTKKIPACRAQFGVKKI
jgi:hypothetical protein